MLRYLEAAKLVVPPRTPAGYRVYRLLELNQLRSLRELRARFGAELSDVAFAARLGRGPALPAAAETWLAGTRPSALGSVERKQERARAAQTRPPAPPSP